MSIESDCFNREVPRRLQGAILRAVFDGCQSAHDTSRKVAADWFNDAVPGNRRLAVEPLLHGLLLPKNFRSTVRRTTSTHFTQLESDRVVITAVTRNRRRSWVHPEPYRKTLATEAQLVFEQMRNEAANDAEPRRLYALLVYGGPHSKRLAQFADFVFPTPKGNFAPGTIDLMKLFPRIVEQYTPKPAILQPAVALRVATKVLSTPPSA